MEDIKPQTYKISDKEELEDYKYRMRRDFETAVQRQRQHMGNWVKYAEWEASIGEF